MAALLSQAVEVEAASVALVAGQVVMERQAAQTTGEAFRQVLVQCWVSYGYTGATLLRPQLPQL